LLSAWPGFPLALAGFPLAWPGFPLALAGFPLAWPGFPLALAGFSTGMTGVSIGIHPIFIGMTGFSIEGLGFAVEGFRLTRSFVGPPSGSLRVPLAWSALLPLGHP